MEVKKAFLAIMVVLATCFTTVCLPTENTAWAAPGDTLSNPIIITTAAQLDNVRSGLNKFYRLNNNIDLTPYLAKGGAGFAKWSTEGWMPIGTRNTPFTGGLDGNGYKITGLWFDRYMTDTGLFGYVEGAAIAKLGVEIAAAGVKGNSYIGGLVGSHIKGSITNCYVTGYVSGNENVGGLVGWQAQTGSNITNCYATGNIDGNHRVGGLVGNSSGNITNCYATGNVTATGVSAGGLVGDKLDSNIANSYATGNVNGNNSVGGLVGLQYAVSISGSSITNCYAIGNVTAYDGDAGGLVGHQSSNGFNKITNSYRYQSATVNGAVRTENTPNGIHGGTRTASQLTTQSTYTGWTFGAAGPWYWDSRKFPKLNMGVENIPFYFIGTPGDSPNNPIIITTAAQLDNVRNGMNKYYRLNSNINLTSYLASGGAGFTKWGTAGWMPIGVITAPFTGGLDGNGYKITGLRIDRSSMDDVGLFGCTMGAIITKLGLDIAAEGIKGYGFVGGLVGHCERGSIINCYVTGNVSGTNYIGGLTGHQYWGIITKSYTTSNISGHYYVGGLTGGLSNSSITNSYATGRINGYNQVGGLAGFQDRGTIDNSYATGKISGTENVGGLVGWQALNNNITGCYATGDVSGKNSGGLVGWQSVNSNNRIWNSYRFQFATINGVIRSENTPTGIHGGIKTEIQLKTQSTYTSTIWTFSTIGPWYWDSRGFPKLNMGVENYPFSISPGDTSGNPIIITTAAQLDNVRNGLNKYYRLNNDIDLTSYLASGGAGFAKWGTAGWMPIGTNTAPFIGSFDGNGYKITGLRIDRSSTNNVGLFGYTSNATIAKLGVEIVAAGVKGLNYVGGLVGHQIGGNITNCYAKGNVSGFSCVGGLVGRLPVGNIINCYSTCNITDTGNQNSSTYFGGLVGIQGSSSNNDVSNIENSYASGSVTAKGSGVGGLVGYQGSYGSNTITNCYAAGNVTSSGDSVGGLVGSQTGQSGSNNSITKSYATGNVNGRSEVGGLVGLQFSNTLSTNIVTNSYATGNVSGSNAGGVLGLQGGGGTRFIVGNFRYQFATINGVVRTEDKSDGIHGGIRTSTQLKTQSTYTSTGWTFGTAGPWYWDSRGFPKLNMGVENYPFSFAGSPGDSRNNPIVVTTAAQLDNVRNGLNKYYWLNNNIDLTSYLASGGAGFSKWGAAGWLPIGTSSAPFTGGLDGNGYKITGLRIDRSSMNDVGLFGFTRGATIVKLGVDIAAAGIKGNNNVGGLVGWLGITSSITNCYVTGKVSGVNNVGGLVGWQTVGGIISNSYATGSISGTDSIGGLLGHQGDSVSNCYAIGNVTASKGNAGGLVGWQSSGSITNSYATGNVSGNPAGGLLGLQSIGPLLGNITNSYATGDVSGTSAGGLVGKQTSLISINRIVNSYRYQYAKINGVVRTENTPNGMHGGIRTASQFITQSTYAGWKFSATGPWYWDKMGFPKLNMGTENFPWIFVSN